MLEQPLDDLQPLLPGKLAEQPALVVARIVSNSFLCVQVPDVRACTDWVKLHVLCRSLSCDTAVVISYLRAPLEQI